MAWSSIVVIGFSVGTWGGEMKRELVTALRGRTRSPPSERDGSMPVVAESEQALYARDRGPSLRWRGSAARATSNQDHGSGRPPGPSVKHRLCSSVGRWRPMCGGDGVSVDIR